MFTTKQTFSLRKRIFLICLFALVLGLGITAKANAATYYVDSSITDTHVGSATPDFTTYNHTTFETAGGSDSVFKTIADINAFNTLQPGDYVYFRKGQTWREQLTVPASGTSGNVITFGAFGSRNNPIIYGSTNISGGQGGYTWTQSGVSNEWYLKKNDGNPGLSTPLGYVWVDNSPYLEGTVGSLTASQWDYADNDSLGYNTIYVFSTTDPSSKSIEASHRTAGIYINSKDYIQIENFEVRHSGYSSPDTNFLGGGIYMINDSDYITISNCTANYNHVGLTLWSSPAQVSNITVNSGQYNYNWNNGITGYRLDTITLNDVTVNSNGRGGFNYSNDSSLGSVNITDGDFSSNGTRHLATSVFISSGIYVGPSVAVTISGTQANSNYGNNIIIYSCSGNLNMFNTTLNNSSLWGGLYVWSVSGNITLNSITAEGNNENNIYMRNSANSNALSVTSCTANNSVTGRGIYYESENSSYPSIITVQSNTVDGNYNTGIGLLNSSDSGTITVSDNTIKNNGANMSGNGLLLEYSDITKHPSSATVEYNYFEKNGYHGDKIASIWLDDISNVTVRKNFFIDNYGNEITVTNGGGKNTSNIDIVDNVMVNTAKDDVGAKEASLRLVPTANFSDITIYNNSIYNSSKYGVYFDSGSGGNVGNLNYKNNITSASSSKDVIVDSGSTADTEIINNNLWYNASVASNFSWLGTDYSFSGYKSVTGHDASSVSNAPSFTNSSGSYSSATDFKLAYNSPAIDAGTDVGLTSDYAGNPIYGTPDIGAYEYQPPHTMGADEVDISAGARVYGDGKFRDYETTSGTTADLEITPSSGSFPSYGAEVRPAWMDVTDVTWSNSGTRHKAWTESSMVSGLTNTVHTVGDLSANKYYNVKVDDVVGQNITGSNCATGFCKADSQGKITFTYTGTYSTHTFDVEEAVSSAEYIPVLAIGKSKTYALSPDISISVKSKYVVFRGKISEISNGRVDVYQDGLLKKHDKINKRGKWRVRVNEKSKNATHIYQFKYFNRTGELTETTQEFTVIIDRTKPVFTYLPKTIRANPGDIITWQVSDNDQVKYYKYTFRGKKYKTNDNFFVLPDNLPKGTSKLIVRAYDRAENLVKREAKIIYK